ncbi:nitroreductase [Ravibacter arvi]
MSFLSDSLIRSRRSIFPPSYVSEPISKETIMELLENANHAPTHRLTQPWRFTVFTGEGLKTLAAFMAENYRATTNPASFSQAKYDVTADKILRSGAVIAINVELHPELVPEWEEIAATAAAVQNIWLSAWERGIGGYWSSPGGALEPLGEFLNLPENQKNIGLFYLGRHNAAVVPARRSPVEEKTVWIEA